VFGHALRQAEQDRRRKISYCLGEFPRVRTFFSAEP
jgi:hypothetical protein